MLHVGDIYLTCTFISYILMFELCRASLTRSIGRNAKLKKITTSCSPIVWSAGRGDDMRASAYMHNFSRVDELPLYS